MSNYYFLASSLPELQIGVKPELTFSELNHLLKENLQKNDRIKMERIRRYYDLQNIRAFWKEEPFSPYGNLNPVELEENLVTGIGLPGYVMHYLEEHNNREDALAYFPRLICTYFDKESDISTGFLRDYLTFEREWRLVLTGFRAKVLGRDLLNELQFENPDNELVAQIIAQKDAKSYEPPYRYEELKPLFESYNESPPDLYQALCVWRFNKVSEMLGVDMMSIERVLGYMAQLIMVEMCSQLDQEKGKEILNQRVMII